MFNSFLTKYFNSKNTIFFIIAILFLIFLFKIQDIAVMFFAAYVISCSLNPLADKLSSKFKRKTASAIVLVGFITVICAFFVPLVVLALYQIKSFAVMFPEYLANIKAIISNINHSGLLGGNAIDVNGILSSTTDFASGFINKSFVYGKNIGSGFVYLLVGIIITYYFMADRGIVRKTYLRLFPSGMQRRALEIADAISEKVGGYVIAQIATMASVGVIMTIGLYCIKSEYALLLGLITSVLDIIPVIGPFIALIICLIASFKAGPVVLLMICVIFAVAQLVENNFVRPYIFGKFLDIHPIVIYLFLFLTAKYLGITGVIFAPAIAATAVVLVEELYIKNIK